MHPEHDKYARTDIWREGKWLDLWSVVHLFSGFSIGFVAYYAGFGDIATLIIVLLGLIAYEMWEALMKIEETPMNRFMDVVVGMVGFLPIYYVVAPWFTDAWASAAVFSFIFATNITGSIFGWIASKKAAALQEKTRERYRTERARIKKRMSKVRTILKKKES